MPDEHQHHRPVPPELAEPHIAALDVLHARIRQFQEDLGALRALDLKS